MCKEINLAELPEKCLLKMSLFPPMYSWQKQSLLPVVKLKSHLFIRMLKKISGMTKSTSTQLVQKSALSNLTDGKH